MPLGNLMKGLLQLNSSIFSSGGQSTQLADQFVAVWQESNPDAQLLMSDLAKDPLPHLTAEGFLSFLAPADSRTAEQQAYVAVSEMLIEEIRQAQIIVIGLPMYNFGIPSTLKAYFDQIARSGITFRYTENGPQGLLTDKKVYIFAARGGNYLGTPLDTQTSYVRDFLGFLGMNDVEFVYAEGMNKGDGVKEAALAEAKAKIKAITQSV